MAHLRTSPSSEHSASPGSPISIATASSRLLSPPSSDRPSGSPPPRADSQDYLAVSSAIQRNRHQKSLASNPDAQFGVKNARNDSLGDELLWRQRDAALATSHRSSHDVSRHAASPGKRNKTFASLRRADSMAVMSLRKIKTTGETRFRDTRGRTPSNLMKGLHQLRSAFISARPPSNEVCDGISSISDSGSSDPVGPASPQSITLRKASGNIRGYAHGRAHFDTIPFEPATPFVELVAFREAKEAAIQAEDARFMPSKLALDIPSIDSPMTLTGLSDQSPHMQTKPASPILTFADPHIAPGTFSICPRSRRVSVHSDAQSRRLSMIQLKSRDSVYEVIWREGESASASPFSDTNCSGANDNALDDNGNASGGSRTPARSSILSRSTASKIHNKDEQFNDGNVVFNWSWKGRRSRPSSSGSRQSDQRKRRKSIAVLHSAARTGDRGRVGSCIGISSHRRMSQKA